MPRKIAPFKRLLAGYKENQSTGCWEWIMSKYKNGYGQIKVFGKMVSAHRYSYEIHKGPIKSGFEVMHTCDVKSCINPDHLIVGTHGQNMADARERGLMPKGCAHTMWGRRNPRPEQANIVRVMGVVYESQKAAEKALGLGSGTVRYWLVSGSHKAELIKRGKLNG